MYYIRKITLLSVFVVYNSVCLIINAGDIPYYGSHGFGTQTEGGLSGKVIKVTNLNKEGPGSFRMACEDSGSRLVVFEVGGVIDMELSTIIVTNPYLTVAGQTAPSPGITLIKGALNIRTHDVVIQHIAVRPGDATTDTDAMSTGGDGADVHHVVFDHCSATWSTDENLSMVNTSGNHDITLYKCLIAEGLNFNNHSCGSLIYGDINNLSILGCLYAHNVRRNPRINNNTEFVLANNIFYNWATFSDNSGDYANCVHLRVARGSIAGNLALGGSNTQDLGSGLYFVRGHDGIYTGEAYFEDNLIKHADGHSVIKENDPLISRLAEKPLWPEGFVSKTAFESADDVLRTVGSRAGERDTTDNRIVNSVIHLTGRIINRQSEVEDYPKYSMTNRVLAVPETGQLRREWLDSLSSAVGVDDSLDTSPLTLFLTVSEIRELQNSQFYFHLVNSPNSFDPFITIQYFLPRPNQVTLKIYSLTGREIATLVNSFQPEGQYEVKWISEKLPSGLYFCRLQADEYSISKKIIILK